MSKFMGKPWDKETLLFKGKLMMEAAKAHRLQLPVLGDGTSVLSDVQAKNWWLKGCRNIEDPNEL